MADEVVFISRSSSGQRLLVADCLAG